MDNENSHLKFDLASKTDTTPSEDDNSIRKEMHLRPNQVLVSKIYKLHWREDVSATVTDVIVPVNVPDVQTADDSNHCFYFLLRWNGTWRKEKADNPRDGKVHGHLNKVDAFAVILEIGENDSRIENMTIGPEGGKFVSKKDGRISVDFPQGALDKNVDFQFKAAVIGKERYEEYLKLSPDFRCIQGFTHTLGISPEVDLNHPAQVCLPLDVESKGDNSEVLFLHWKKNDEGKKVAHVMSKLPSIEPNNCYNAIVGVATSSAYAPVCVPKKSSRETITTSVEYLCGRRSLCTILTFLNYDKKYKFHRMLVDCVDFYKVDAVLQLHKQNGMEEVEQSRSRDIEMKKKTRIKISLEGNLTFFDQNIKVNSLLYDCYARTNKVMFPVTTRGGRCMSIVRYSWDRDTHQVFFFLHTKTEKRTSNFKEPNVRQLKPHVDNESLDGTTSMMGGAKVVGLPTIKAGKADKKNDSYAQSQVAPMLTDKSLSALSDSLPQSMWRIVGIELNFTNDHITTIFETAERSRSDPRFDLLREWRTRGSANGGRLIQELVDALTEIGRNDIAEVLKVVQDQQREIRRSDFGRGPASKTSMKSKYKPPGEFIFPDGI